MAIFTNGVFPSGGEAGDGGGIIQVAHGSNSGEQYYYKINEGVKMAACYADITPRNSSNKILIFASLDGVAHRGGSGNSQAGEFEGWLGYNASYNGNTVTSSGSGVSAWTNIGNITGLGAWYNTSQAIGSYTCCSLHSPNTTNICRYTIIVNRRSAVYFNNEFNTGPDAGGTDQGTTLLLMEVSS